METSKIKNKIEELVHNQLYVSGDKTTLQSQEWLDIKKSLNGIDDLRTILVSRNNENYYVYEEYIKDYLCSSNVDIKLDILNNSEKYGDIIKINDTFIAVWLSLKLEDQIKYLNNKKKYNKMDLSFINEAVKDNSFCNSFLNLIKDYDIRKKITPYSISINNSYIGNRIDLTNFDICSIFTKESYTNLLLRKCKKLENFLSVYNANTNIYNMIANNGLTFPRKDNDKVYSFLRENPNFIGKFNEKYLDLFSIVEINFISKIRTLDSDAYSTIISRLYKYDPNEANQLFSVSSLKRCSKHSIKVFPFLYLSEELRNTIFNDYLLFNKFIDVAMIEAFNNYFDEDTILNILRDDTFIEEASPYAIELLLNKLSFKATFNMLQRKTILDKVSNLNIKITSKDNLFIKGYLDSPLLVYKSQHNMLCDMLNELNSDDVFYYLSLPYIVNSISSYEITNIVLEKNVDIRKIINSKVLKDKFSLIDLINYINKYWAKKLDLSIFDNKELCSKLFKIDEKMIDDINFDEVNYLYETIRMKSLLSKQEVICSIDSYKCVLYSYLVLGLDKTLELVNKGNSKIDLDELKKEQRKIIEYRLLSYKSEQSAIFGNMPNKVINALDGLNRCETIQELETLIKKDVYLDNIVYLMINNSYDSYDNVLKKMFGYKQFFKRDKYRAKKEIFDYVNDFIVCFFDKKKIELNKEFEEIILNNFRLKEKIVYKERIKAGKDFINKMKLKVFVRALTDPKKIEYARFFRDDFIIDDIVLDYTKCLKNSSQDFDEVLEHILTPLMNERFDITNCLEKLGVVKPSNYDKYIRYWNNVQAITKVNMKLSIYNRVYSKEEFILILNYICYGSELNIGLKRPVLKQIDKLKEIVDKIDGDLYIDKVVNKIMINDKLDIYNIDEIKEYRNYVEIIEGIIKKTNNYIKKNIIDERVLNEYSTDYYSYLNGLNYTKTINSDNYDLKKRVLSLKDICLLFEGYSTDCIKKASNDLIDFIDYYGIYYVEGYYNGLVGNFGFIISDWDKLKKYSKGSLPIMSINEGIRKIRYSNNKLTGLLDEKIFNSIIEDSCYYICNLNDRINKLNNLYCESLKKVSCTIPYISYKNDRYEIKVLDNYDPDSFISFSNSSYKIGAIGNDLLTYSLIHKNGCQIGIYYDNKMIAKSLGVRNGNVLYLNGFDGEDCNKLISLIKSFGNAIIKATDKSAEPIELVTLVNNEQYNDKNGCIIDKTNCPIISYPINDNLDNYKDYSELINNKYSNYDDSFATLVANSVIVDKNNFKVYDSEEKYYRRRNSILRLCNNVDEACLRKINRIMLILNNGIVINDDYLSQIDSIFLGDDFVIFIDKKEKANIYQLPYDKRANIEIDTIIKNYVKK